MENVEAVDGADLIEITDRDGMKVQINAPTLHAYYFAGLPLTSTQQQVVATAAQCCQLIRDNGHLGVNDQHHVLTLLQTLLRVEG